MNLSQYIEDADFLQVTFDFDTHRLEVWACTGHMCQPWSHGGFKVALMDNPEMRAAFNAFKAALRKEAERLSDKVIT